MAQKSLNNLSPGKKYAVQVRAIYGDKASEWSPVQYFTTISGGGTPSTPAAPTVAANTMQLQITHNNKKADNVTTMEDFVAYYEVYASTSSGFTPSSSNLIGKLAVSSEHGLTNPVISGVFNIPAASSSGTLTSTTSASYGTGSKSFTVSGNTFVVGERIRVYNTVDPSSYMEGVSTTSTSTSLVITSDVYNGSGTNTNWTISKVSQLWYAKVIAVSADGQKSVASASSSAPVTLVDSLNIKDATITSAKIVELTASKITSGSIKTGTITIGNASPVISIDGAYGIISTGNYVSGTSGWSINYDGSAEFNNIVLRTNIDIQSSTSSTANRIVLTNTGISAYKGSTRTFFADGSTGNVTITGNFTLDSVPGNSASGVKIESSTGKIFLYGGGGFSGYNPGQLYSTSSGDTFLYSPYYTGYTAAQIRLFLGPSRADTSVYLYGQVYTPDMYTGSGSAVYFSTSAGDVGHLYRATSSLRYKTTIQDLDLTTFDINNLRPVVYRDKKEYEKIGLDAKLVPGFIGEEMDQYPEIKSFIGYNGEGEVDYILYDRLAVIAIAKIQELDQRIKTLEQA